MYRKRRSIIVVATLFIVVSLLLLGGAYNEVPKRRYRVRDRILSIIKKSTLMKTAQRLHPDDESHRMESVDAWRPKSSYPTTMFANRLYNSRPLQDFADEADYLRQPIVSDFVPGARRVFLMLKTGGTEMWSKVPVHWLTTLTKFPYFAIYSDAPGSIGGNEVIDILANMSASTLNSTDFDMYRMQKFLHNSRSNVDYSELRVNQAWDLDRFKNVPMLYHAYRNAPDTIDWFVFIDADTYLMADNLVAYLNKRFDASEPHYLGSQAFTDGDQPFAHGGTGVAISKPALSFFDIPGAENIVKKYEKEAFDICCGDALVARMLRNEAGIIINTDYKDNELSNFQGNPIWEVEFHFAKWCQPILSFHHVSPHDIEVLWEYERLLRFEHKEAKTITYAQLYNDFILPFIDQRVDGWDNLAGSMYYSYENDVKDNWSPKSEGGPVERPYESVDGCRKACLERSDCFSWRLLPAEKYCGYSTGFFQLGRPVHNWIENDSEMNTTGAISGWMTQRIRAERVHYYQCDNSGKKEGWYRQNSNTFNVPRVNDVLTYE
ncbi:hypothetical protein TRVA0_024S00672 [Trichomonascus vanleenenianus]|uniref:uncharacterized protein n=1 Tax=Trichomonascus vanleenenianus TaxID=2268995 RepID=UPI003ECA9AC3